jgi:hypothetical protein
MKKILVGIGWILFSPLVLVGLFVILIAHGVMWLFPPKLEHDEDERFFPEPVPAFVQPPVYRGPPKLTIIQGGKL